MKKVSFCNSVLLCALVMFSNALWAKEVLNFPQPAGLKPDVNFWIKVYTEVTTKEGFIHDSEHLNVIYERLSFEPGVDYKTRKKIIKQKKEYYKEVLEYLASNPNKKLETMLYRRIKGLWPKGANGADFEKAAKNLRFQLGQSDRFKNGLVRSGRWMSFIKDEFNKLGIPEELSSLPHVESSFRSDARSHAGAAGLWQFTRPTGRRFMRVDHVVDERLDPFLATKAAGKLLKNNHEITGTWPLALTAYNHGAAGMRRAVESVGGTDITKIVREYKGRRFGFASRNFYNAFVAANRIEQQPVSYFGKIQRDKPWVIEEVKLPSYYTAKGLIKAFGVKNNIFKSLNPALQQTVWTNNKYVPKGYHLRLPVGLSASKSRSLLTIPGKEKATKQKTDISYKVRKGDSLTKIAQRFKVRSRDLAAINNLRSQHKIRIGQVLKLPSSARRQATGLKRRLFYKVRRGDTLIDIAKKFAVSSSDLATRNRLKSKNHVYVGQKLRIR